MKKVIAISVLLSICVGFVLGLTWKKLAVYAAGRGDTPVGNGDVNGDGTININDVVYTLYWLFTGEEAPVPIDCPPPVKECLLATGQTKCYDNDGVEIPCDSADFPGQDGFYQKGCPTVGRFVDHGDGSVTDTCTGLMWQKDTADVSGNRLIGDEDRVNWQDALTYCDGLDFAGHDDWRLPNVRELQSIIGYLHFDPAIDPVFRAEPEWYWSSSPYAFHLHHAWIVSFRDGVVYKGFLKNAILFVRAVRDEP